MRKRLFNLKSVFLAAALLFPAAAGCAPELPPAKEPEFPFEDETPTGLVLDEADGTLFLRWQETDADGYNVYRSKSTFGTYEKVNGELLETPRFTSREELYAVYRVTAVKDGGEEKIGEGSVFSAETLLVAPTDDMASVQACIDERHARLEKADSGQFSDERFAIYFFPGEYDLNVKVGYYTTVAGLGRTPDDVKVRSLSVSSEVLPKNNATCTFWRSAENLTVKGDVRWAVSQATSLRRMRIEGDLFLSNGDGWSSGGFLADSEVTGTVYPGSQQQWMARNSSWGKWDHCGSHNYVFSGCEGAIPQGEWTEAGKRATVLPATEKMAEKPYLTYDEAEGFRVFVPAVRENRIGTSRGDERGYFLPLGAFHIASGRDSAETLNRALEEGKHLFFPAGRYSLDAPLEVTLGDTVLFGSGYATLKISEKNGDCALRLSDADGIRACGLLADAGKYSKNMVVVGEEGEHRSHSDPIVLSDLFLRIGGAKNVHTETETALAIHADDTVGDNFWVWRADHSSGVEWEDVSYLDKDGETVTNYGNPVKTGVLVTGNDVSCYALMVEHCEGYQTFWKGERGLTVMYQSETPYRVPSQEKWMSGSKKGCASYKVDDGVTAHRAYGVGIYLVNYSGVTLASAIEAPETKGIALEHLVICAFTQNESSIENVVNGFGGGVGANVFRRLVEKFPMQA